MHVLGVTGGIGSGKSTVARLLQARGARVLDADEIVHELYLGGDLPQRIAARFGRGVLRADGAVRRSALGKIVFGQDQARRDLEDLVLPTVRATILSRLDDWREAGFRGVAVIDAALLVEAEFPYPLDALLVVTAPRDLRLDRLEARGVPREAAESRMRAQASDDVKLERADVVVENRGSLPELEQEVERAVRELGWDAALESR